MSFDYRGLKCKSRKSRNTWSNRQIWPWSTEWSRAKANRVLPRECTGHSKHHLPTTQKKTLHMDITRWSTPNSDWLYSLQPKMQRRSSIQSAKIRLGADCGSYHELLIAKFRLKLKKVGKTTGEGNGNPLQYACLENPGRGAWWAAVYGVAPSRTRLKWLSSSSSSRLFNNSHSDECEIVTHRNIDLSFSDDSCIEPKRPFLMSCCCSVR